MRITVLVATAALALGAAGSASAQSDDNAHTYVYGSAGYVGHDQYGTELGTVDGRIVTAVPPPPSWADAERRG
jgi:hypothetical protein